MAVSNLKDRFLQVGGGYIAEAVGITEVDRRSKVGKIEGWGWGLGFESSCRVAGRRIFGGLKLRLLETQRVEFGVESSWVGSLAGRGFWRIKLRRPEIQVFGWELNPSGRDYTCRQGEDFGG